MIEIGQLALDLVINLLASVIYDGVSVKTLPFFERRRIERRIEDATAEAVEPLLPFLAQEKIPEDKQRRLLETCVNELLPFTKSPERLFQGSLDGQKIYEELYADNELPEVIIEDDLKEIYALLCPRIATLLCKIPAAVKDWENEAWSENYRRLDDISGQMRKLFTSVDELATTSSRQADEMLLTVRMALAQKVRLQLDLTGLRADRPLEGRFDDFFVHPEIKEVTDDDKSPRVIETQDKSFATFTQPYSRTIVVGAAGAGKSTWTKWLQRESVTSRWSGICIRVELRGFAGEELPSLHDLVRETVGKHLAEELSAERISHWLKAHYAIFILDGFDEIRPTERDSVYDWITDLAYASQGCPIVLTSRVLTTDHLEQLRGAGWLRWSIEPFDEMRIIDYIERWHFHTPLLPDDSRTIDPAELAREWRGDPTIKPLTGNPLLLSTLLMVHHLDGSLPSGRSQLYKRYVAGMLGLWDDRRNVAASGVTLTQLQKQQIIRGFAIKLFFDEQDQLDEADIQMWLSEFLHQMRIDLPAKGVLNAIRERSGLIVGPGIYSFAHKSIAEYLVAEVILQGDQRDANGNRIDRFRLFEHRNDDRWNTVLFLWAGLAPTGDVEAFIEECIVAHDWALAYGVLFDQYERISAKSKRRFILRNITLAEEHENPHYFISWSLAIPSRPHNISGESFKDSPSIGSLLLRFVGNIVFLGELTKRAMGDGVILWNDMESLQGIIRDHLWMHFIEIPQSIESWRACLTSPYPSDVSSMFWQYGALVHALRSELTQEKLGIDTIIHTFQETCSHARGIIPLVIISLGLELILTGEEEEDQSIYKKIYLLLEILPSCNMDHLIREWLLASRVWHVSSLKSFKKVRIQDILVVFPRRMDSLLLQGVVERNEIYERAMQFISELRVRREALEDENEL